MDSFLFLICIALLIANTFNVGADLAAMADAAEILTGIGSHYYIVLFAIVISWATVQLHYYQIANILKWFTLFLFAYVIVVFVIGADWAQAIRSTFLPSFSYSPQYWSTVVAVFGTTISPYLFFWQTSMEVEEEKAMGRRFLKQRQGANPEEILMRKYDVAAGTFFSNLVMYFIILATALTLHRKGVTQVESTIQVIEALKPLAGRFATLLYTIGLLGVGFLAIPTLTSSAAYAISETFHWHEGLDLKFKKARAFYGLIIFSTFIAVILDFSHFNPITALYASAMVNGILSPILLFFILIVASDKVIMRGQPSSLLGRVVVGITCVIMLLSIVGLFLS
jgi:Mn2+/Fe2+ NRAMP family transporter